jgi:hypothetical protein
MGGELDNKAMLSFSSPAGTIEGARTDKYPQFFKNLVDFFELTEDAARFVIMIERFSQFFDDVADGDEIKREDLDLNLFNCFIGLNTNSFFLNHRFALLPVMELIILKWQGSDKLEREGKANEKTFMWRAAFYDLLMAVMGICHSHEYAVKRAPCVLNFYAETMEDYKKEFSNG